MVYFAVCVLPFRFSSFVLCSVFVFVFLDAGGAVLLPFLRFCFVVVTMFVVVVVVCCESSGVVGGCCR
jgi:hypothetical protein